jgi:hypothetical protein
MNTDYIWSALIGYFAIWCTVLVFSAMLFALLASATAIHKGLCGNCYFWAGLFFGPLAWFVALVMPMQSKVLVPREV